MEVLSNDAHFAEPGFTTTVGLWNIVFRANWFTLAHQSAARNARKTQTQDAGSEPASAHAFRYFTSSATDTTKIGLYWDIRFSFWNVPWSVTVKTPPFCQSSRPHALFKSDWLTHNDWAWLGLNHDLLRRRRNPRLLVDDLLLWRVDDFLLRLVSLLNFFSDFFNHSVFSKSSKFSTPFVSIISPIISLENNNYTN